ncbi:MAG: ABC transporter ATP-binding protein [Pseudomonadales bacterium]
MSLQNVSVRYKKHRTLRRAQYHQVLESLDLDIYPGDSIGVIGRNGAGKSTLLRLLAGVIDPDGGVIDRKQTTAALLTLQLGFDQQLDGRTNILLSGMLMGCRREVLEEKMSDIIDFSGLGAAIGEPVKHYSSGMKARLGFSIALMIEPDILLIDEVLGVGDETFREKSAAILKDKMASDHTVILVSHNTHTVKKLCNRVIWIEDGKTRMMGDTHEVVDCYIESMTQQ